MKKDKLKLYLLEISLTLILFLALFVSDIFNRRILAIILIVFAVVTKLLIKRKKIMSIYKNQATWLMLGFAVIYLIVFYLTGLYFGYYKASATFGISTIWIFVFPLTCIIISSEIIRKILIMQKGKASKVFVFIIMVLIDLIVYSGIYDVTKLDDMLTVVGFILFASISCNLLYNYITERYGNVGVIIYRLITVLYIYFIPYIPDVYLFFRSFLRMLYPFIIYLIFEYTYSKTNHAVEYKDRKKEIIGTTLTLSFLILLVALISCRFKYGIIVIGSGSMTGSLNKGDAVVYESYTGGAIEVGDVLIFKKENIQVVHRVINIINVNGQYRYYTKGDANPKQDDGYILKSDIIGVTVFRIAYIGYPSIWVQDMFS